MWIYSKQRAEPYLGLTCLDARLETGWAALRGETCTGAAWLSSARVVRCWVKSLTSVTLAVSCQRVMPGTLAGLPVLNRRKVGMTSSHHGLYAQGLTRATMADTERSKAAGGANRKKSAPVRIAGCQLACMKVESLVIAYQL